MYAAPKDYGGDMGQFARGGAAWRESGSRAEICVFFIVLFFLLSIFFFLFNRFLLLIIPLLCQGVGFAEPTSRGVTGSSLIFVIFLNWIYGHKTKELDAHW